MSLVQSVFNQLAGALFQFVLTIASRDRRALVIERRAKVLALAREMKAVGITATQLRTLERRLTSEE
jgi:hypothetical protein